MSVLSNLEAPIIDMYRGNYKPWNIAVTKSDGTAYNLTGMGIDFMAKADRQDDDEDALITKSVTVHTNAVAGLSYMELLPADTNAIDMLGKNRRSLYFDFSLYSLTLGNTVTFNSGILQLNMPVKKGAT
jgi:hypothetical protein